jgi:multiple sugar transport system substrate-binding protein
MAEPRGSSDTSDGAYPRLTRRAALRFGILSVSVGALLAACTNSSSSGTSSTPAAQATTAPAAATSAPATGATAAPTAVPLPTVTPGPTFSPATINGKLTVIQARDFYEAHNAFIEAQIRTFAQQQNYPLDHSYIDAYAGSGDVVQKLTAAVQANNGPDLVIHTLGPGQLHFLDIIDDVDALEKDLETTLGEAAPAYQKFGVLDGLWYAVPHFSRSGGYFIRQGAFQAAGVDPSSLTDFNALRDAALKISQPTQQLWGWGMTANRSGDGDTSVRSAVFQWGGQVTDDTGQVVVLNTEPYRDYAIAGLTWLQDIYTNTQYANMLPPGVGGWTDTSNNEAWLAGKIGITNNAGTLFAQAIADQNPVREDTYLINQPNGVGPGARLLAGPGGPMWFFIMKGAANRDAAEQLIRYLSTMDMYRQMFQISTAYVYPARSWGWDEPAITENQYAQHVTATYQAMFNDPSGWTGTAAWPGPPSPQTDALENSNFWTDMFGEILGGKSPADAVADAHNRAVQTFQEFGAKGQ